MSVDQLPESHEFRNLLRSVRWWLRAFTVALMLMTLALLLTIATVFGQLVDWHGGEVLLRGAVAVGAAVLGFGFGLLSGWLVCRRV